jgi:F0F1-type ATP synthase assembly protein I
VANSSPSGPKSGKTDGTELAGLGLTFGASIVAFTLAGNWADERLGTSPLFLLVGVFLGFGLSLAWIYRRLVIIPRDRERGEKETR